MGLSTMASFYSQPGVRYVQVINFLNQPAPGATTARNRRRKSGLRPEMVRTQAVIICLAAWMSVPLDSAQGYLEYSSSALRVGKPEPYLKSLGSLNGTYVVSTTIIEGELGA